MDKAVAAQFPIAERTTRTESIAVRASTSSVEAQMLQQGLIGAALGALVTAPMFGTMVALATSGQATTAVPAAVYLVSGAWLGTLTGGILGAIRGAHRA